MMQGLTMDAPGASSADIERGVVAAMAVFGRVHTTPAAAAWANWKREADDVMNGEEAEGLTAAENIIADAWWAAHEVALAACYRDRAASPEAQIRLVNQRVPVEAARPFMSGAR